MHHKLQPDLAMRIYESKEATVCRSWNSAFSCGFALLLSASIIAEAQSPRPSATMCDNYARNYSQNSSRQGQMLRGGAIGSLGGLGIGSIVGSAGAGAAIGAGVGLVVGGAKRAATADRMYNAAYQECMAGLVR